MTVKNLLIAVVALLSLVEFALLGFIGLVRLAFSGGIITPSSPEVAAHATAIALAIIALAAFSLIAAVTFPLRPRGFGWWLMAAVQAADFLAFACMWVFSKPRDSTEVTVYLGGLGGSALALAMLFVVRKQRLAGQTSV